MVEYFRKVFRLREGEGGKVFRFASLFAFLQAGIAIGFSTADAMFLSQVGVDKIPVIYILAPAVMLLYIPVYTYLISRFSLDTVFRLTLIVLTIGGLVFFGLLMFLADSATSAAPAWLFYIIKLYTVLWSIALYTLFWNFTDSYFDIQDGKRLYAIFSGGGACGAALGGGLVSVIADIFPVSYLFIVWAGLSLLTMPVLFSLRKNVRKIETEDVDESPGFSEQLKGTARAVTKSRYVVIMTVVLLSVLISSTLCEFQYFNVFSMNNTEQELASLFGMLFAVINVFNLLVNFFLFNRLVLFFGVRNTALILPIVYVLVFGYFIADYGVVAAMFGFFAYHGIVVSIDINNFNFLFNAIPAAVKKQVRTILEGLCEPLATSIAGWFLLIWATDMKPEEIAYVSLGVAFFYLIAVIFLRYEYVRSMIQNLKSEWFDFSKPEESVICGLQGRNLNVVHEQLQTRDLSRVVTALHILWRNDKLATVHNLLEFLKTVPVQEQEQFKPLLTEILREENNEIIRMFLEWLESNHHRLSYSLKEALACYDFFTPQQVKLQKGRTQADDLGVRATVLVKSWHLDDRIEGLEIVRDLLEGPSQEVIAAIRTIGHSEMERLAHFIVPYLHHKSGEIRHAALEAINELINQNSSRLLPSLLSTIHNGNAEERIEGMNALRKISDSQAVPALLTMSHTFTPFERRYAEQVITSFGLKSVPTLISVIRSNQYPYKGRSIAARTLTRIAYPQMEQLVPDLIQLEIERAYRCVQYYSVLSQHPAESSGYGVLMKVYHDLPETILDFILELLALTGRIPDYDLLIASLHSSNLKDKGNAIETVEQGIDRHLFLALAPLMRDYGIQEKIQYYQTRYRWPVPTAGQIIDEALNQSSSLTAAAAAQLLWVQDQGRARMTLREKHSRTNRSDFQQVIQHLLTETGDEKEMTIIDRMYHLSRTEPFSRLNIQELRYLSGIASLTVMSSAVTLYKEGDPADFLYALISGQISVTAEGETQAVTAGATAGMEAVHGYAVYRSSARTDSATALRISRNDLTESANIFPRIAVTLLNSRLHSLPYDKVNGLC